jgi:hypothetical protein
MTAIATLLAVALFAAAIYHYAPRASERNLFHLDQFRPAAPLAGLLPVDHDQQRLYSDLAAMHARQPEDEADRAA